MKSSTFDLPHIGHSISCPLSSKEYSLMLFKISKALSSSSRQTFSFTPPIAWLTKGSVSTVN
ncbi:hypothetical protein [Gillisia marina]|uniref:hypothetical protein n=1 Tax=Gillisia marina TaxID=1167637 RepID=UPI0012DF5C8F|nr:hypothetical protein [Gillisia marina]